MTNRYSIGHLSREFDVTTRTIRFYEDQGLLAPARSGRNRVYSNRDRVHLRLILRGKRLGFSLSELRDMLDLYDAPEGEIGQLRFVIAKIDERRRALESQREDIDTVLDELQALERRCTERLAARTGGAGAHAAPAPERTGQR